MTSSFNRTVVSWNCDTKKVWKYNSEIYATLLVVQVINDCNYRPTSISIAKNKENNTLWTHTTNSDDGRYTAGHRMKEILDDRLRNAIPLCFNTHPQLVWGLLVTGGVTRRTSCPAMMFHTFSTGECAVLGRREVRRWYVEHHMQHGIVMLEDFSRDRLQEK